MSECSTANMIHDMAERELLKWTAGRLMFCPNCERILDWSTTILVDVKVGGETKGFKVFCNGCAKEGWREALLGAAQDGGFEVEISAGPKVKA